MAMPAWHRQRRADRLGQRTDLAQQRRNGRADGPARTRRWRTARWPSGRHEDRIGLIGHGCVMEPTNRPAEQLDLIDRLGHAERHGAPAAAAPPSVPPTSRLRPPPDGDSQRRCRWCTSALPKVIEPGRRRRRHARHGRCGATSSGRTASASAAPRAGSDNGIRNPAPNPFVDDRGAGSGVGFSSASCPLTIGSVWSTAWQPIRRRSTSSGVMSSARGVLHRQAAVRRAVADWRARSTWKSGCHAFQLDPTASPGSSRPVAEAYARSSVTRARARVGAGHRRRRRGRARVPHGPRIADQRVAGASS